MKSMFAASIVFCVALATSVPTSATETENHNLPVLPVLGKVTVDGKSDDWDLSGGLFVCGDVERLRDQFSVWVHAMYDDQATLRPGEMAGSHAAEQSRRRPGRLRLQRRLSATALDPRDTTALGDDHVVDLFARSQRQKYRRPRLPGARRTVAASDRCASRKAHSKRFRSTRTAKAMSRSCAFPGAY